MSTTLQFQQQPPSFAERIMPFRKIILVGFIVGTLDCLAAFIDGWLSSRISPEQTLKFIASAVLGRTALQTSWVAVLVGLLFHYFIAQSFTFFFVLLYPYLSKGGKNPIMLGIAYGIFIWLVMRLLVLPLTRLHMPPLVLKKSVKAALILIIAFGIPLALLVSRLRNRIESDD